MELKEDEGRGISLGLGKKFPEGVLSSSLGITAEPLIIGACSRRARVPQILRVDPNRRGQFEDIGSEREGEPRLEGDAIEAL